jgi:hypothetical protein
MMRSAEDRVFGQFSQNWHIRIASILSSSGQKFIYEQVIRQPKQRGE